MKATLSLIAFEMRMSNNERVKDLYYKAFEKFVQPNNEKPGEENNLYIPS